MRRTFIVGCPRSGTSLLQSCLAAHPAVFGVAETHFFERLTHGWFRPLGLVDPRVAAFHWSRLADAGRPPRVPTVRRYARGFARTLDRAARAAGAQLWVEKTPGHVYEIDTIQAALPTARFVHIVRDGRDVVASLYRVSRQSPKMWGGPYSLESCIDQWLRAVHVSLEHRDRPGHLVLRYRSLVTAPEETLAGACEFLDLDFSASMLADRTATGRALGGALPWHAGLGADLHYEPGTTFHDVLDPDQRALVLARIGSTPLPER